MEGLVGPGDAEFDRRTRAAIKIQVPRHPSCLLCVPPHPDDLGPRWRCRRPRHRERVPGPRHPDQAPPLTHPLTYLPPSQPPLPPFQAFYRGGLVRDECHHAARMSTLGHIVSTHAAVRSAAGVEAGKPLPEEHVSKLSKARVSGVAASLHLKRHAPHHAKNYRARIIHVVRAFSEAANLDEADKAERARKLIDGGLHIPRSKSMVVLRSLPESFQGDITMYTTHQMHARRALRRQPAVVKEMDGWWDAMPRTGPPPTLAHRPESRAEAAEQRATTMTRDDYEKMCRALHAALLQDGGGEAAVDEEASHGVRVCVRVPVLTSGWASGGCVLGGPGGASWVRTSDGEREGARLCRTCGMGALASAFSSPHLPAPPLPPRAPSSSSFCAPPAARPVHRRRLGARSAGEGQPQQGHLLRGHLRAGGPLASERASFRASKLAPSESLCEISPLGPY